MENYKKVDSNYLHNKIINNDYKKILIQKIGVVEVSLLNLGEKINIYYYNEHAEIQTKPFVANVKDLILITKKLCTQRLVLPFRLILHKSVLS